MHPMLQFLLAHYAEIVTALAAIHVAAMAIVNLTPTPKDNEFVENIYRYIEVVAGILHESNVKK